jgi:hypothetical protein
MTADTHDPKRAFTDEHDRIPGTNAFNFSKWVRENDPPGPGKYTVGSQVILVVAAEVVRVFQDCDGTTLYELSPGGSGWGDDSLLPAYAGADDEEDATVLAQKALDMAKRENDDKDGDACKQTIH